MTQTGLIKKVLPMFKEIRFQESNYKKAKHAAFLVALKSADDEVINILLVGDDMLISLDTANYDVAIFYLLCYYFIFGEEYPPKWSEFLTFFQVYCLKQIDSVKKGIPFRKFEEELQKFLN